MTVARPITPDLAAIDGIQIVSTTEPLIGAPLGIEWWRRWRNNVAVRVEPAGLQPHADDAERKVPRSNGIDHEGVLTSVPVAEADDHSSVERGGCERLDLGEVRHFELGHGAGPVVEGTLPTGDDVCIEKEFGHGILPGGKR